MSTQPLSDRVTGPRVRTEASSRLTTSTLFAAALLAFLLPFATVSCGEPVSFTGLELATARVTDDARMPGERSFGDDIEANGTAFALVGLVAAGLGLGLAAFGARGVGPVALVGLLALLFLPWSAALALADFAVHSGYVLAVGALGAVVAGRRVAAVQRRRRQSVRVWPAVLAGVPLAGFVAITARLCIDAAQYV